MAKPRREILILGAASPFVSQAIELAEDCGYRVAAVVDNLGEPLVIDRSDIPLHLLGSLTTDLCRLPAVCCVGTPDYRRRVVPEAAEKGITSFVSLLHPTAYFSKSAGVGVGGLFSPHAVISAHSQLGDHVFVRSNTTIAHNCVIGDYVTVGNGVSFGGLVHVETGAYIGIGARILPRVRIGANAIVAAGAVVTVDVPAHTLVTGAPARVKREGIPGYRG